MVKRRRNYKYLKTFLILGFVISLVLGFKSQTLTSYAKFIFIFTLIFASIGWIVNMFRQRKVLFPIILIILYLVGGGYYVNEELNTGHCQAFSFGMYENIFSGECKVLTIPCTQKSPSWYYKSGCGATQDKCWDEDSCKKVDNLKDRIEPVQFSYNFTRLPDSELPEPEWNATWEFGEFYEFSNEIIIGEGQVKIHQPYDKASSCVNFDYMVYKKENTIEIIPEKIIPEPEYNPETGEEIIYGCASVLSAEMVEIDIMLEDGTYLFNFYNTWGDYWFNKTIQVGEI